MMALLMVFVPAWLVLAAIAAWGSYRFSLRDPRSTSWVKIGFAGFLLSAFGVALAIVGWFPAILDEGLFAHGLLLFFVWPMIGLGAPLCIGSILGTATAMHRNRNG